MDRIIITISKLSKNNWVAIYKFIKSIVYNTNFDSMVNAFSDLKSVATGIKIESNLTPETSCDAKSNDGRDLSIDTIKILEKNTCFSIIYQKDNNDEDFTRLVPFVLIQQEFGNAISLGIDIGLLELRRQEKYTFKCADFFFLLKKEPPKLGNNSIYFINEVKKINESTGEVEYVSPENRITRLKGEGDKGYTSNSSRRFLPLIKITENNYRTIFGINDDCDSKELKFIKESIEKIKNEWNRKKSIKSICSELNSIFNPTESHFGQWLESGYFYSYDKELKNLEAKEIQKIRKTLQIYKNSIVELVQNIISHGGKEGLLYCVFDKKANVSHSDGRAIPDFKNYDSKKRFLKIGIYDFGEKGIVDTFSTEERVTLTDFFDINSIVTTDLTRLDLRYAAHLGIKTFVKTVVDHKGYFSVESCNHIEGRKIKKFIHTKEGKSDSYLSEETTLDFVNGTHYLIILPVIESEKYERSSFPVQTTSVSKKFSQLLKMDDYPIRAVRVVDGKLEKIGLSKDKKEQCACIKSICNELIEKNGCNRKEIALDLGNSYVSPTSLFKIAAFLQLKRPLEKIVIINVTNEFANEFCSLIDKLLVQPSNGEMPIWSKDCALVFLSDDLHVRIIWGQNKDELYYINREYKKLYYNHFLDIKKDDNPFDKDYLEIENIKEDAEKFVLPYDVLIRIDNKEENGLFVLPFERFLDQLLRREIISSVPGLSVNHENTYIGRKIIVRNFYEADSLFQNNFFVERFAYQIACNLKEEINKSGEKTLVLIGYKYYSEFLLKTVQDQLKPDNSILLGICNEGKESSDNNVTFSFDINGDFKETEKTIIEKPDKFVFATIVPIGATLSTNDKIISYFKQWFEKRVKKDNSNQEFTKEKETNRDPVFIYNHCAIVVRDRIGETNTDLEQEQKWDKKTDFIDHCVYTGFRNVKKVYYTILIANRNLNKGNWVKRLNREISFPNEWVEEEYVNLTENSSINSQNLMDYPKVVKNSINEDVELERIYGLMNYLYKGHLKRIKCHHKYYIDTESFVRQNKNLVKNWLEDEKQVVEEKLRKEKNQGKEIVTDIQDTLNVLVTPNVESESDFVSAVNEFVFNGSALIIYLDVNNWRNNIVNKLSFLGSIPNVRYHYVDQAFLTGATYHKSKSYLFSIVGGKNRFYSAFTIVNRLPFAKSNEIREDLNQNLFAYLNIHYPMGKEGEQECELCRLDKYYENLSRKTVLQSCSEVINKNRDKIKPKELEDLKRNERKEWNKRNFLRFVITHWLYYRISEVTHPDIDFEKKKDAVKQELDNIYSSLCNESGQDNCLLNQKIEQWFNYNDEENKEKSLFPENTENKDLILDKKLSFLKVISSPPLSQYIAIREYAHKKLLVELYNTINKREQFVEKDLKVVKSVLKSLSFLKSNALVRKDVIVGVWRVLEGVIKAMGEDEKRKNVQDFSKDVQFFVKNAIVGDEAKATFLGELLRRGEEMSSFNEIQISNTRLMLARNIINGTESSQNQLFEVFRNHSSELFRQEYSSFLVWLFYDNTTIIRNTLANFSWELDKDDRIRNRFYDGDGLKSISVFKKDIREIKKIFDAKVRTEYYYSSFRPYLENRDSIDFVEKLVYVTYAKLKLEDLIKNNKTQIETDTRDLMEIFAAIMGADAAFWTMRKKNNSDNDRWSSKFKKTDKKSRVYSISLYDKELKNNWDYDQYDMTSYYTYQIYGQKELYYPLIPKYSINLVHGENKDLKKHSLGVYTISEANEGEDSIDKKETIVSCITFLYKDSNPIVSNEEVFRIKFQESGRLLLLLKKEIYTYVVGYLLQEKVFELWEKVHLSSRRFEKIYANSSHVFNNVYKEMDEFESLGESTIKKLSKTWFFLTNETISFLYSTIERNPRHNLRNVEDIYVEDNENTLGKTFSEAFILILTALYNSRWKDEKDNVVNAIYINRQRLDEFKMEDKYKNVRVSINKHLIRTFIAQCLNNSLYLKAEGKGHRYSNEMKRVDILLSESKIIIKDSSIFTGDDSSKTWLREKKKNDAERFYSKKKYIKSMMCDEYSCTTLTTLQGVADYLQLSCNYGYSRDFGCNNYSFIVSITINKKDEYNNNDY